jgi:DNA-directed RNA polymerase specialized sigma24 family protein
MTRGKQVGSDERVAFMTVSARDGRALALRVVNGDRDALDELRTLTHDTLWDSLQPLGRDLKDAEALFEHVWHAFAADEFQILRRHAGDIALAAREVLEARALALLKRKEPDGWMFEAMFEQVIRKVIALQVRRDQETHDGLYNEISDEIRHGNYALLNKYEGNGSLGGWIRRTVKHSLIDIHRDRYDKRVHKPEGIKKLSTLDQKVWELIYRKRMSANPDVILPALGLRLVTRDAVADAIKRVIEAAKKPPSGSLGRPIFKPPPDTDQWVDPAPTPPETSEESEAKERVKAALRKMIAQLPADDKLYLRLVVMGLAAEAIVERTAWSSKKLKELRRNAKKMREALKRLRDDDADPTPSPQPRDNKGPRKGGGPSIGNEERGS